jgi:hypothetical protein
MALEIHEIEFAPDSIGASPDLDVETARINDHWSFLSPFQDYSGS